MVRKRVVDNFRYKLDEFKLKLVASINDQLMIYNYDYELLDKLRALIASYLGHMNKADSYRLQQAIFRKHDWLNEYFGIIDLTIMVRSVKTRTGNKCFELEPRYQQPKIWHSIIDQYGYYRHHYLASIVLFQVGSYYEFYHELDSKSQEVLQLGRLKTNRRKALYGFPLRKEAVYLNRLLKNNYSVLIVRETGNSYCQIKERVPVRHYVLNR